MLSLFVITVIVICYRAYVINITPTALHIA